MMQASAQKGGAERNRVIAARPDRVETNIRRLEHIWSELEKGELQRLPLEDRLPILSPLIARVEDAKDTTLSLMYWYALQPLVPLDKSRAAKLATETRIPLLRQFIARRLAELLTKKGAI